MPLKLDETEEGHAGPLLELHQEVQVAPLTLATPHVGTEDCEGLHAVLFSQFRQVSPEGSEDVLQTGAIQCGLPSAHCWVPFDSVQPKPVLSPATPPPEPPAPRQA